MKITYFIGSLGFGGKERQLYYLLKNLQPKVEKQLIVLSNKIYLDDVDEHVDDLLAISRKVKYHPKTIHQIYKQVNRFKPNIIHCWDEISPFLMKPYCLRYKTKLINGSIRTARPINKQSVKNLVSRLREFISDLNISNSRRGLVVKGLDNNPKATYIHNGFDLELFDTMYAKEGPCFGISDQRNHVCMVGRFFPSKDYHTLISACEQLRKHSDAVSFHAIGDGPAIDDCKNRVTEKQLDNFVFHGSLKNVPAFLSKCQIGVILNPKERAEGISNAIMEYMAAKIPVIVTDAGGTPELVQDGVNGFFVTHGDPEAVADKILFLKNNPEKAKKMGEAGRNIIEEEFSISQMIDNYFNLYYKLLHD